MGLAGPAYPQSLVALGGGSVGSADPSPRFALSGCSGLTRSTVNEIAKLTRFSLFLKELKPPTN